MAIKDGRLIINQPLIGFNDAGGPLTFSSWQGRFDGTEDMYSHGSFRGPTLDHAFDWGGGASGDQNVFIVAPIDSYVVLAHDTEIDGGSETAFGGFGNTVTLRAAENLPTGDSVFLSFSHLQEGSVPFSRSPLTTSEMNTDTEIFVEAGTIIGIMGETGAGGKHLHMQVGTDLTFRGVADANGGISVPPVYMLGFEDAKVTPLDKLNPAQFGSKDDEEVEGSEDDGTDELQQDLGFPIGDTDDGEPSVASGIRSTISRTEFNSANRGPFVELSDAIFIDRGNEGVFARFDVAVFDNAEKTIPRSNV